MTVDTRQTQMTGTPRWHMTERRREYLAFILFVMPNLTLLIIWTYWPFFHSFYLSLTNWNLLKPTWDMVGVDNYLRLLRSPEFWQITRNTLIFSFGTVTIGLTLSLALAVSLNQWLVARGFWRLVVFSPHITTSAAMALVWISMYDPKHGIFAAAFSWLGLRFPNVLASPTFVLPAIMLVAIWKSLGFSTVVLLAALQGVDTTLKEAAAIDGANAWQIFRNVSFPAITPVFYFLTITGLMTAIKTFDIVSVMTGGGPANRSNMYVFQIYREAFGFQRMGVASALAVIMFVIVMLFTYLQTRYKERWVSY
ncbi:MAG: sugar ABC transporter permease [Chloroflexota bacterium]|jgi:sn-glycerol 3-phosphate transport system permease protein|nr:sugar ABC transporter permease [Chloroflexota bacterium]